MHDDPTTRVPPERRLDRGTAVKAVVVCHHPFGMGVFVESAAQYGHVDAPNVRNAGMRDAGDFPPVGTELTAVVLRDSGVGQLRLSTRLRDLPGYTLSADHLPE
jgi:hypothetical protein